MILDTGKKTVVCFVSAGEIGLPGEFESAYL